MFNVYSVGEYKTQYKHLLSERDIIRFHHYYTVYGEDNCWNWTGPSLDDGRSIFLFQLKQNKQVRIVAARLMFELKRGTYNPGVKVCHTCDNVACVNPNHLFLGTLRTNNTDRNNKNRSARLFGESNPRFRFTTEDIENIRYLRQYLNGNQISKIFKCDRQVIYTILSGKSRKNG
jgi:hypothetical protein